MMEFMNEPEVRTVEVICG